MKDESERVVTDLLKAIERAKTLCFVNNAREAYDELKEAQRKAIAAMPQLEPTYEIEE
jgi:hypothetical protein